MLTPEFIGGLATGEGCFSLSVRRQITRKGTRVLSILPSFQLCMKDGETVDLLCEALAHYGMAHHRVARRKQDGVYTVSVQGLKRMAKFLPWITPHLTGDKKRCAENVAEFVAYRLALPPKTPVSQTDLDYLERARRLNGNQGQKYRTIELHYLSRILRDSTPDTPSVKIESVPA